MRLTSFLLALFISGILNAQETFPTTDVSDKELVMHAFVHCTLHIDWETTVEDATLLIHRGRIVAAGADVEIPEGTVVEDLQGKHIYPSFIDLNSEYGMPATNRQEWKPQPQYESNEKGAYGWNESLKCDFSAARAFVPQEEAATEYRNKGFGTVLTHREDGIMRGTSCLVGLGTEVHRNMLIMDAAAHSSFRKGSSRQKYPSSLMGAIALLRQTLYDAEWYATAEDRRDANITLETLNRQLELVQFFDAGDKWDVLRADRLGDEFDIQYVFQGNGDEYQRLEDIRQTGGAVVVPVNFPAAYDMTDPYLSRMVSLTELMHWEQAPANIARLLKAEVPIAITSEGTKGDQFIGNLRKAISAGADEAAVLKALTMTPAALIHAEHLIGSLEPGKWASFLVCSAPVFDEGSIIYENWIQGQSFVLKDKSLVDIAGTYNLTVNGLMYTMNVSGKAEKYSAALEQIQGADTLKIDATLARDRDYVNLRFKPDSLSGVMRLNGTVYMESRIWEGKGQLADGTWMDWSAVRQDTGKGKDREGRGTPTGSDTTLQERPIVYPFMAYGRDSMPGQQTVWIRNATLWTCEEEGIIEKGEILIHNGKIAAVGRDINLETLFPRQEIDPVVIDAKGKHVTPGIIDEHSHIAVTRGVNEGTQMSSAEVQIGTALNPEDINIYRQLSGGVTCSQLLHGSANPIGGQSALIKLRWGASDRELLVEDAAPFIKFALGENVKQSNWGDFETVRFPQTRMGVEQVYYELFLRAAEYDREWRTYKESLLKLTRKQRKNAELPVMPRRDLELEALAQILKGERFITCHSYRQDEINMLMHVADSMGFTLNTFTHILEGYKVADKMKEHGAGGSTFSDWWAYKFEVKDAIPHNAALLTHMGITTAINSDDAEMARRLNQEAAKAVKYGGLDEEEALRLVTLNPAKLLHVDDRMGSLSVGKDADLVIWSDHPLSVYARAEQTYVDGRCMYDLEEDERMRAAINQERSRIIQLMLDEPSGSKRQPRARHSRHYHCDSEFDEITD
ncbi:MAG: amidohydrolase family protein [Flavobacteriales bacterium]|nr:amidohydrolase family protein [Flavobacteriales bacterium]